MRKLLFDTSAALRDPAVLHLLAFDVVRRIYTHVAANAVLPRSDPTTAALLQLLELGVQAPAITGGHPDAPRCLPPPPPDALHTLLPILAGVVTDIKLAKVCSSAYGKRVFVRACVFVRARVCRAADGAPGAASRGVRVSGAACVDVLLGMLGASAKAAPLLHTRSAIPGSARADTDSSACFRGATERDRLAGAGVPVV